MARQRITRTYIGGKPIVVVRGKVRAQEQVQVEQEDGRDTQPDRPELASIASEVASVLRHSGRFPREWWTGGAR